MKKRLESWSFPHDAQGSEAARCFPATYHLWPIYTPSCTCQHLAPSEGVTFFKLLIPKKLLQQTNTRKSLGLIRADVMSANPLNVLALQVSGRKCRQMTPKKFQVCFTDLKSWNMRQNKRKSFFLLTLGSNSVNTHIFLLSETWRLHKKYCWGKSLF